MWQANVSPSSMTRFRVIQRFLKTRIETRQTGQTRCFFFSPMVSSKLLFLIMHRSNAARLWHREATRQEAQMGNRNHVHRVAQIDMG